MNEVKIYKLSPDGFDEVSEDQVNYDFDVDFVSKRKVKSKE